MVPKNVVPKKMPRSGSVSRRDRSDAKHALQTPPALAAKCYEVLVVSQHRPLLVALKTVCGCDWHFCQCATHELETECVRTAPDAIVLDLALATDSHSMIGVYDLLGRVACRYPVVALFGPHRNTTGPLEFALRGRALCSFAVDDEPEDWLLALKAAARGAGHLSPSIAARWREELPPINANGGNKDIKPLSMREREVLELAQAGLMPQQIANRLHRSVKTVEAHFQRIKIKLGVRSMTQLRRTPQPTEPGIRSDNVFDL